MTRTETVTYRCDECGDTMEFTPSRSTGEKERLDYNGWTVYGDDHFCPSCNDRERCVFAVRRDRTDEQVDTLRAWNYRESRQQIHDKDDYGLLEHSAKWRDDDHPTLVERIEATE